MPSPTRWREMVSTDSTHSRTLTVFTAPSSSREKVRNLITSSATRSSPRSISDSRFRARSQCFASGSESDATSAGSTSASERRTVCRWL